MFSSNDISIILDALSTYYNTVHPDNSVRKDILRLIKEFSMELNQR